jgi:hypothetical protein
MTMNALGEVAAMRKVRTALETASVIFVDENGHGCLGEVEKGECDEPLDGIPGLATKAHQGTWKG